MRAQENKKASANLVPKKTTAFSQGHPSFFKLPAISNFASSVDKRKTNWWVCGQTSGFIRFFG